MAPLKRKQSEYNTDSMGKGNLFHRRLEAHFCPERNKTRDHSHSLLVSPIICLPGSAPLLAQQGKFTNELAAVEIQWPVPTLKKYSSGRLKVDKYHISIQVMQPWVLHVFNDDIIYRSWERYWCNISWLWKNEEKQINFCGDSRPPAMRETFRAGYFHSCDWLSGLSETTAIKT